MVVPEPLHDYVRDRSVVVLDVCLALGAAAFALVAAAVGIESDEAGLGANETLLIAVATLALVVRRRYPGTVLAVVLVARTLLSLDTGVELALLPAAMLALYTVGRRGGGWVRVTIAAAAAASSAVVISVRADDPFVGELAGELGLLLLPLALGEAMRGRAERLGQRIDAEAQVRVQAERLRIARDLHDVVAHGLSAIAVQSGVAARLVERDPAHAAQALEGINESSTRTLDELRAVVGALRSSDRASFRPAPTNPESLDELLERSRALGLEVSLETHGSFPADASDACIIATHRILQEALTNVARHAGAVDVAVRLRHRDRAIELVVSNETGSSPAALPSAGIGIVGMRERAQSLGGTFEAEPTEDGGFVVRATLPYRPPP